MMKTILNKLALAVVVSAVHQPLMAAVQYDRQVCNTAKTQCVGFVKPGNPASTDPINGDLYWISTAPVKISGVPKEILVLDSGVIGLYSEGSHYVIKSWSAADKSTKVCRDGISVSGVKTKAIKFNIGNDFFQIIDGTTSSTAYYADCKNKGKEKVWANLTDADRAVLMKYGSEGRAHLTDPKVAEILPEILGQDKIVDEIISTVRAGTTTSTLLWGKPGIGKTSTVERLAKRISLGEVPEWFKDWSVYSIDLAKLNDEGLKGRAQQKMSEIVTAASGKKVILLMDEIHQIIGVGTTDEESGADITEVMKTALADGRLCVIGTLTDDRSEMAKIRTKEAFFSRFNRIALEEPSAEIMLKIMRSRADKMKRLFGADFSDEVLEAIIKTSKQYIPTEYHPRLGIQILEAVASKVPQGETEHKVTIAEIKNQIGIRGNIASLQTPDDKNNSSTDGRSFQDRVRSFKTDVATQFIGHPDAINSVYKAMVTHAAQSNKNTRPGGVFLFLGPSGVGKTYLAELTAKLFDMPYRVFGMSQYTEEHMVTSFLGAPPSYVGYNPAGGVLTQWINDNPNSVLNFDEIDKAHPVIINALMGLLETGKIEDNSGIEAIFRNGFIFFTSNFGMDLIDAYDRCVLKIKDEMDFGGNKCPDPLPPGFPKTEDQLRSVILNKLQVDERIGTYIVGRVGFDRIILFHHLADKEAQLIAKMEVKKVLKELNVDYKVTVDQSVIDYIVQNGFSFNYGARRARSLAENIISFPVAEKILELDGRKVSELKVTMVTNGNRQEGKVEALP